MSNWLILHSLIVFFVVTISFICGYITATKINKLDNRKLRLIKINLKR